MALAPQASKRRKVAALRAVSLRELLLGSEQVSVLPSVRVLVSPSASQPE
jgi:hypothetical protein